MKQECICFHTIKGMAQAEEIFKINNMKIIFKSKEATLELHQLTPEEQESWKNEQLSELNDLLYDVEILGKEFPNFLKSLRVIQKLDRKNNYDELDRLWKSLDKFSSRVSYASMFLRNYGFRGDGFKPNYDSNEEISCGIIIGQKNGNTVRYLEFLSNNDPIVTITGNHIGEMKNTLQNQFDVT